MESNEIFPPCEVSFSALMKSDTNLLASDEEVYRFLGQDFSVKLIDFVPDKLKAEFLDFVKNCTYYPSVLITKLKRFDGIYADISVIIRKIKLKNSEYIDVRFFDIISMTDHYYDFAHNNIIHASFSKLINGIYFIFYVEENEFHVYKGGQEVFCGPVNKWCGKVIADGIIEKDCREIFRQIFNGVLNADGSGYFVTDTSFFGKNGSADYHSTSIRFDVVSYDRRPAYVVGIISDMYFPDRSAFDPLTGLYNKREIRRITDEAFADSLKNHTRTVTAIIDLDHFKEMNDTYGHLAGDKALINATRIIKDVIGKKGIVGRIGGDEFFAVFPDFSGDIDDLRRLLRCIRTQIHWHFKHCREDVNVTCSIGAAVFPDDADNYDSVFKLADHCLYLAKAKGRNRFVIYTPQTHGSLTDIIQNGTVLQKSRFSEAEKLSHLLSVISRCNTADSKEGKELFKEILKEIRQIYELNAVQFCSMDKTYHFEVTDYSIEDPFGFADIYDTFKYKIEQHGFLALGNYMNSQNSLPKLAEYMSRHELRSVLVIPCNGDKQPGLFAATNLTQHSWSEFDINGLMTIFGVLERFVK